MPELDPAGPVHAGEERVLPPPRPQLVGDCLGVALVAGEPPRGGEHGQVVVPGHLPDLLDVAGDRLVAVVDAEREDVASGARRPVTGSRNQSGSAHVRADDAEHGPGHRRGPGRPAASDGRRDLGGDLRPGDRAAAHAEAQLLAASARAGRRARHPGRTCRRAHGCCRARVDGPAAHLPGDICRAAATYQPTAACSQRAPAARSTRLGLDRERGPWSSRPASRAGSAWARPCGRRRRTRSSCGPLTLVLPGRARACARLPSRRPRP